MTQFTSVILGIILLYGLTLTSRSVALPASLNAIKSNARLLSPRSATASVYDGVDTIYIMGGWYYDPNLELIPYADIHAYNISSDTIRIVGELPRATWAGIIHHNATSGDIYFLRGDGTFLWRYVPSTGETTSVSEWLGNSAAITAAFTRDNKIITFGGLENPFQVYRFDFASGAQGTIGELPVKSELSVGIYVPEMNKSFLFAGELGSRNPVMMCYNHLKNTTEILNTTFPSWRHGDGVIVSDINGSADGMSIFLIGAAVDNGARGNGLIQYIPHDFEGHDDQVNFIPIQGLPDELSSLSAVYVRKLNRIYIFGGYDLTNVDRDEIWYINLSN